MQVTTIDVRYFFLSKYLSGSARCAKINYCIRKSTCKFYFSIIRWLFCSQISRFGDSDHIGLLLSISDLSSFSFFLFRDDLTWMIAAFWEFSLFSSWAKLQLEDVDVIWHDTFSESQSLFFWYYCLTLFSTLFFTSLFTVFFRIVFHQWVTHVRFCRIYITRVHFLLYFLFTYAIYTNSTCV